MSRQRLPTNDSSGPTSISNVPESALDGGTLVDINLGDRGQMDAWIVLQAERARLRIREELVRLTTSGVVDATGKLLREDEPPDMLPHSKTDVAT